MGRVKLMHWACGLSNTTPTVAPFLLLVHVVWNCKQHKAKWVNVTRKLYAEISVTMAAVMSNGHLLDSLQCHYVLNLWSIAQPGRSWWNVQCGPRTTGLPVVMQGRESIVWKEASCVVCIVHLPLEYDASVWMWFFIHTHNTRQLCSIIRLTSAA